MWIQNSIPCALRRDSLICCTDSSFHPSIRSSIGLVLWVGLDSQIHKRRDCLLHLKCHYESFDFSAPAREDSSAGRDGPGEPVFAFAERTTGSGGSEAARRR